MDFSWPQEYIDYRKEVVAFAQAELQDDVIHRDKECIFPAKLWKKCADFGIMGLASVNGLGGEGDEVNIFKSVVAMEALGYACKDSGLTTALNAQMWLVQLAILSFGTEEQKKKYIPPMVAGDLYAAHALTEENAGSDVFNMQMRAEKVDGGYILNGKKRLITLAPIADVALIFANAKPDQNKWGITAFLVEKSSKGYSASPPMDKMGLRTIPLGEITLDDCFIPEENRLGKEGGGLGITNYSLEYDRCFILAGQLGAMERQLEETIKYAKKRKQFGQSIGKFQSVSNRIVDMKMRLETSRLLLHKLAWMKQNKKMAMLEAAMSKLFLSENMLESSIDAVRTRGGNGFLTEYETERELRDATGGVLYAGTSDIQRNVIARFLGL